MATTLGCQRLVKRTCSRQDRSLLVAEVGLVGILIMVPAVFILRLGDCILCGGQVTTLICRVVIHVAYDTLSAFVVRVISTVTSVSISVIARFVIARTLAACITCCIVIAPSLLPTWLTAVALVIAFVRVGLSFFADVHNDLLFSSG